VAWGVYRNVAVCVLALSLTACAAVSTDRPLFTAADTKAAPVLKAGLWAVPEPGCQFKSHAPPAKWPDCVQGLEVRDGTIKDLTPSSEADRKREAKIVTANPARYLVAATDPAVLQVEIAQETAPRFYYFGLQPLATDADGAVIRLQGWIALCRDPNPPPPAPAPARPAKRGKGAKPGKASQAARSAPAPNGLLPGLTSLPGSGGGCTTSSAAAAARAVAGNEAWAFSGDKEATGWTAFWIRDDLAGGKVGSRGTFVGQAARRVASMRKLIPHF